ncbi:hypothetical protein [Salibacterium lacus]|uniref:Lipoprotein n=1 Tax=Salibacterium lacus TaxID=1898109 RepID=A0ABW5SWX5_9BACI
MTIGSLLLNLFLGLISGSVVSCYFKRNEEEKEYRESVYYEKQSVAFHLQEVRGELTFLIDETPDKYDIKQVKRIASKRVMTENLAAGKHNYTISEQDKDALLKYSKKLEEIKSGIDTTINNARIKKWDEEIAKIMIDVLKIKVQKTRTNGRGGGRT